MVVALSREFALQNVKCAGCVGKIESALNNLPGVINARVNLLEHTLQVEYSHEAQDEVVIAKVTSLGYGASLEQAQSSNPKLWLSCGIPLISGLGLMLLGMSMQFMQLNYATVSGASSGLLIILFSLVLILASGWSILRSGINGFRQLSFNMHSLITLGVASAWFYSSSEILLRIFGRAELAGLAGLAHDYSNSSPAIYFDSALIIIALINLGAYFEERAKTNTTKAIKALSQLQPEQTTILQDGVPQQINSNLLRTGYVVMLRPGERVPADGVVVSGAAYVDESLLTGEPIAIYKQLGDKLIAGSITSGGSLCFSVTGVGANTLLAEIIALVKTAQMSKPALAKLADQVARVFVPLILLIALISSLAWLCWGPEPRLSHALTIFMSILIIACPCSVGLAIPVALMVGVGRSASKGILIRDARSLSSISDLSYILLDKTGTITAGKPQVVGFSVADEFRRTEFLAVIKALEQRSEHPLAQAICAYQPDIAAVGEMDNFTSLSGSGVSAQIAGQSYWLGSLAYVRSQQNTAAIIPAHLLGDNHFSQVFLATERHLLARLDLADVLKSDSRSAIQKLQQQGLKVAMVTGDNLRNAAYIADQVGISEVYAECKPADKIALVKRLQQEGNALAFVGDGVNDAPSLAQANVGIALGAGTDIAMHSASIILMRASLHGVSEALRIGHAINRNMRQNLFGSFIYNALAVLIAAGILYPTWHILLNPIIASVAMSASSLTVISNALRLRRL